MRKFFGLLSEQILFSSSSFAFSIIATHKLGASDLSDFYFTWLWSWGLVAILFETLITTSRVESGLRTSSSSVVKETDSTRFSLAIVSSITHKAGTIFLIFGCLGFNADWSQQVFGLAIALGYISIQSARFFERDENRYRRSQFRAFLVFMISVAFLTLVVYLNRESTTIFLFGFGAIALITRTLVPVVKKKTGLGHELIFVMRAFRNGWKFGFATLMRVFLYSVALILFLRYFRLEEDVIAFGLILTLTGPALLIGGTFSAHIIPTLSRDFFRMKFKAMLISSFIVYAKAIVLLSIVNFAFVYSSIGIIVNSETLTKIDMENFELGIASVFLLSSILLSNLIGSLFQLTKKTNVLNFIVVFSGILTLPMAYLSNAIYIPLIPYLIFSMISYFYFALFYEDEKERRTDFI
jgi:hypothetical protein